MESPQGASLKGKRARLSADSGENARDLKAALTTLLQEPSLERIASSVEQLAASSSGAPGYQQLLSLGSRLMEAGRLVARQQSTAHNAGVWPFPQELTVRMFELLDMRSLAHCAAVCSLFNRAAMDPSCLRDVDLAPFGRKVNDCVVAALVQRSGGHLRTLKLGILPLSQSASRRNSLRGGSQCTPSKGGGPSKQLVPQFENKYLGLKSAQSPLTRFCLSSLYTAKGVPLGLHLRCLHLYNVDVDEKSVLRALAVSPALEDLEIVGTAVNIGTVMERLGVRCQKLRSLSFQPPKGLAHFGIVPSIGSKACLKLVSGCPSMASLTLRGVQLKDRRASVLLKGLPLEKVDFSFADQVTGAFLGVVQKSEVPRLRQLVLRDCMHLKEDAVRALLQGLALGECPSLEFLDITNKAQLAGDEWFERRLQAETRSAIAQLQQKRGSLTLLADFPEHSDVEFSEEISLASSLDSSSEGTIDGSSSEARSSSDSDDEDEEDDDDSDGYLDAPNGEEDVSDYEYLGDAGLVNVGSEDDEVRTSECEDESGSRE